MMDIMFNVNLTIYMEAIDMRYPPEETAAKHRRILEEAGRLFRERGFAGVSVSEIMKATGLTHGPFYNHFASKEALMAEALADLSSRTHADFDRIVAEEGIAAYLDLYLSRRHVDSPGAGCLMTALAADAAKEPASRGAFTAHVKGAIERLMRAMPGKRRAESGARAGTQAGAQADTRAEAMRALAATVGAVMLARAVDDPALGDEILAATRHGLAD
jgi:TetR/AcrR family transcriptional regulator, transcriptional repressor for nem operon